jgi:hypothetical protein
VTERRLRKAAQRDRVSVAEWVRRVIDRALAGGREASDPLDRLASLGGPTGDIEQLLAEIGFDAIAGIRRVGLE